jgi:LmbE family N-acetylglucosaminyl deacetylase
MRADSLWLSPHLDDAVLSSGGAIATLVAAGARVRVLTVCTGTPTGPLSPLAEEIHGRWGLSAAEVLTVRRAEDQRALAVLGAERVELGLLDAIYRLPTTYLSYPALFGPPAVDDPFFADLDRALAPHLAADPAAQIYAPLAIGGHVDHRLVFAYASALAGVGRRVWFYEDLPYALRPEEAARRQSELSLKPRLIALDETALAAKIQAIAAYSSQLASLFGSAQAMPQAISAYAQAVGGARGPAERCFRPTVIHTPRD